MCQTWNAKQIKMKGEQKKMFDEKTEEKINEAVTLEIVNAVKTHGAD